MIKNYFKVAFRNFWRHKLFTLINVVGLTIGISAALVIYLIAHYDLTFDRFYPGSHNIYRVVNEFSNPDGKTYNGGVQGALPEAARSQITGLSQSAPFYFVDEFALNHTGPIIPAISGSPQKFKYTADMILADERYFDMFPYKWLAGSKSSLNKPFTVVLTDTKAAKYFPGVSYDEVVGKTIIYGDTVKATITGIVEAHQQNADFNFNDFISYSTADHVDILKSNLDLGHWGGITPSSQFFVKLADNASTANVEKQLNDLREKFVPKPATGSISNRPLRLEKLGDLHFDEQYSSYGERTANKTTLYGLFAIAAFLLLLGCINFINLTTAQSAQRAKEIGIRKTMGSGRRELVLQFLSETFLITLLAVLVSCALAPVMLRLFADFIPPGIKADFLNQPDLLLFLAILTIAVSLISGLYPATVLSSYKPIQVFKNQSRNMTGETRNAWMRKSLTVMQFAIAQFFIMATIMVSKQVYYALHKDLGFKKEAILTVPAPWSKNASLKQVYINSIKALPQVEMVSLGGASPSSDNTHSTGMTYVDGKKVIKVGAQERFGDENYIKVYSIKLIAGRNIVPSDSGKAFLVNSTFAHTLGFKNPEDVLNKQVMYNGNKMLIAGVIGDFYYKSLHSPIEPLVVVERRDNSYFSSTLHIALKPQAAGSNDWQTAIAAMQASFRKIYPDNDFDYEFFDDAVAKFYINEQHTSTLLSWATGLSVLISCMGLLGLAIYTTNQRTKEIGVRKVLGATVSQIVMLLSTEMAWLIVLAFVIISPVAWWAMSKWMQGFADRTAISWWIFALSGGGMLLTALFTSGFQTIKAALANPVKSLRSE